MEHKKENFLKKNISKQSSDWGWNLFVQYDLFILYITVQNIYSRFDIDSDTVGHSLPV